MRPKQFHISEIYHPQWTMSDCSDFYSRCSNYGQPHESLSIESKDGSLRVKGKDTYHSRDWLKKHGAKFDGNDKSWVFPSTTSVTADVIRTIITDAKAERQAQIKEQRRQNLRKGRETQAAHRKELNDPVKAAQRLENYTTCHV